MQDSPAQVFSQRGTMFKAMARASADNPHIFKLRMAVDQEIAVPCIFILADARLKHRRVLQLRYILPQIFSQLGYRRFPYYSHIAVGIEALSVAIKSNLESAALYIGQGIRQAGMRAM